MFACNPQWLPKCHSPIAPLMYIKGLNGSQQAVQIIKSPGMQAKDRCQHQAQEWTQACAAPFFAIATLADCIGAEWRCTLSYHVCVSQTEPSLLPQNMTQKIAPPSCALLGCHAHLQAWPSFLPPAGPIIEITPHLVQTICVAYTKSLVGMLNSMGRLP